MGRREYARWRVLDEKYGFGERRMDLRFARQTAAIIAHIPFRGKGSVKVTDYLTPEIGDQTDDPVCTAERFDAASKGVGR